MSEVANSPTAPEATEALVASVLAAPAKIVAAMQAEGAETLLVQLIERRRPAELQRLAEFLEQAGAGYDSRRFLGHSAFIQNNFAYAAAALSEAAALRALTPFDRVTLSRALRRLGEVGRARAVVASTSPADQDFELRFEAAVVELDAGEPAAALAIAEPLLMDAAVAQPVAWLRRLSWLTSYLAGSLGHLTFGDAATTGPLISRWTATAAAADADVILTVLDYKAPDSRTTSINIGDYIQTAAFLRHLARRLNGDTTASDPALEPILQQLRETWPEERRLSTTRRVHLQTMDRDNAWTMKTLLPGRKVWTILYGWFQQESFGTQHLLPLPANLSVIIVSFHLDHRTSDLTPEAIEQLKSFAPIGCRDWSTVYWLLNCGVDAFFSGCLTLTIDLPRRGENSTGHWYVDAPAPEDADKARIVEHEPVKVRGMGFSAALTTALDMLRGYADADMVTTSRLHCLLPCRALGVPTKFVPADPGDRRFDGLVDLDQNGVETVAARVSGLLDAVLDPIVNGEPEDVVRAAWRRVSDPLVQEARQRLAGPPTFFGDVPMPPIRPQYSRVALQDRRQDKVTIALAFDNNLIGKAPIAMRSILAGTKAHVTFALLVRGVSDFEIAGLKNMFSEASFRVFKMDGNFADATIQFAAGTTISTMDRLFLPDLLSDLDRIVYLDTDIIVRGDVAELAAFIPSDRGIVARTVVTPRLDTQGAMLERTARRFPAPLRREYRRMTAAAVALRRPYFNAGVMVLSLERLRACRMSAITRGLVERYGVEDQEALNLYSGGDFAELPREWNANPYMDWFADAKIVHWHGLLKPWLQNRPVRLASLWRQVADAEVARQKDDAAFWADPSNYGADWDQRALQAARYVPSGSRVLDLGCGRMALRRFLPEGCVYQPADLTPWTPEVTAVDLNADQFPEGEWDVVALLGVIEYLKDPAAVLATIAQRSPRLVTSYTIPKAAGAPEFRAGRRWINAFSEAEFAALLTGAGWRIEASEMHNERPQFRQLVYSASRLQ